jgi:hypothetical protein
MHEVIVKLQAAIEEARRSGALSNDAARAASVVLTLEGHDAMLACRVVAQGADPASIEGAAGNGLGCHQEASPMARATRTKTKREHRARAERKARQNGDWS